jgi:hypothetical protein
MGIKHLVNIEEIGGKMTYTTFMIAQIANKNLPSYQKAKEPFLKPIKRVTV